MSGAYELGRPRTPESVGSTPFSKYLTSNNVDIKRFSIIDEVLAGCGIASVGGEHLGKSSCTVAEVMVFPVFQEMVSVLVDLISIRGLKCSRAGV